MRKNIVLLSMAVSLVSSGVCFAERESGGRDTSLSISRKAITAVLDQVKDLGGEVLSVAKLETDHYLLQYRNYEGQCVSQGYFTVMGSDPRTGNITYSAKEDQLRRFCSEN